MNARTRMQLLALVAGAALMAAGCGDRSSTETAGQKVDRAADKVAATTDQAAAKAGAAIDDAAITTKVKAAVFAEPGLKSLDINVETRDGRGDARGHRRLARLKHRATQIAQHVEGVRSVSDQLVVVPG